MNCNLGPLFAELCGQPLAMRHNDLLTWAFRVQSIAQQTGVIDFAATPTHDLFGNKITGLEMHGRTAVINVRGIMVKSPSRLAELFGAVGHERIADNLEEAESNGADRIVLAVNSPGGTVTGSPELAAKIKEVSESIPVIAYSDTQMASAAYWIAAGASEVVASPSAQVGSVGVITEVMNVQRALEAMGIDTHVFTSGSFKSVGHPARPMSEDDKSYIQERVDGMGRTFRDFVSANRPDVHPTSLQGQTYTGTLAYSLGFVDRLANSISAVVDGSSAAAGMGTGLGGKTSALAPDLPLVMAENRGRVYGKFTSTAYRREDFDANFKPLTK